MAIYQLILVLVFIHNNEYGLELFISFQNAFHLKEIRSNIREEIHLFISLIFFIELIFIQSLFF